MIYLYIWTNKCEEFPVMDKLLSNTHGVMKITWLPPTGGGDANQEVEGDCTHQTSLKGYYGETWKERCTFGWESVHGDVSDDEWTQRYIYTIEGGRCLCLEHAKAYMSMHTQSYRASLIGCVSSCFFFTAY